MTCRIYEFINITDGQVLNLPVHGFDNQLGNFYYQWTFVARCATKGRCPVQMHYGIFNFFNMT